MMGLLAAIRGSLKPCTDTGKHRRVDCAWFFQQYPRPTNRISVNTTGPCFAGIRPTQQADDRVATAIAADEAIAPISRIGAQGAQRRTRGDQVRHPGAGWSHCVITWRVSRSPGRSLSRRHPASPSRTRCARAKFKARAVADTITGHRNEPCPPPAARIAGSSNGQLDGKTMWTGR